MTQALFLLSSYLLGSIPFGVIVARRQGVDILNAGSGNTGATNVWRLCGAKAGLFVFILDVLKGLIPALFARLWLWPDSSLDQTQMLALGGGLAAVLGHSLSPFLKFRGGKGIATGLGGLLGSTPLVAVSGLGVFLIVLGVSRYISLASIIGALTLPIFGWLLGDPPLMIWFYAALTIFAIARHHSNIKRLLQGNERKFSFRKREQTEEESN